MITSPYCRREWERPQTTRAGLMCVRPREVGNPRVCVGGGGSLANALSRQLNAWGMPT